MEVWASANNESTPSSVIRVGIKLLNPHLTLAVRNMEGTEQGDSEIQAHLSKATGLNQKEGFEKCMWQIREAIVKKICWFLEFFKMALLFWAFFLPLF